LYEVHTYGILDFLLAFRISFEGAAFWSCDSGTERMLGMLQTQVRVGLYLCCVWLLELTRLSVVYQTMMATQCTPVL